MPRKPAVERDIFKATLASRRIKPAVRNQKKLQKGADSNGDDRLKQIFFAAAQLFCEQGYDATTMSDIGDAIGITKAAIYHFVPGGKQDLLFAIINYGMDTVDEFVIAPAKKITDADERLRAIIINHAKLVMRSSTSQGFNPVTVVTDEVAGLSPSQRRKINQRKSVYMDLVRETLRKLQKENKLKEHLDVTVIAFSLIGMIIWLGHWYRPQGRLSSDEVAEIIYRMLRDGILRT